MFDVYFHNCGFLDSFLSLSGKKAKDFLKNNNFTNIFFELINSQLIDLYMDWKIKGLLCLNTHFYYY